MFCSTASNRYDTASTYVKSLDVGEIRRKEHARQPPVTALGDCMCASIRTIDTLRRVFKCSNLYSKMSFLPSDKQAALFSNLKEDDGSLYAGLEETRRTIFLRQTGDN